jgi:hypothetical protein
VERTRTLGKLTRGLSIVNTSDLKMQHSHYGLKIVAPGLWSSTSLLYLGITLGEIKHLSCLFSKMLNIDRVGRNSEMEVRNSRP